MNFFCRRPGDFTDTLILLGVIGDADGIVFVHTCRVSDGIFAELEVSEGFWDFTTFFTIAFGVTLFSKMRKKFQTLVLWKLAIQVTIHPRPWNS